MASPAAVVDPAVRGIVEGGNFVTVSDQPRPDGTACRTPVAYAAGWFFANDCDFGRLVMHSGGYPGYGSLLILSPDTGIGIFAFANRTYGSSRQPLRATLAILNFSGFWAEFYRPLIFLQSQDKFTLPLGLVGLQGNLGTGSISVVLAGVVIAMIPSVLLFIFAQRYFIAGVTAGSSR